MRDFTKGNITKHLISFSLPLIVGDLLQSVYLIVDAVWVGKLLGHQALAAISATFPIFFFLLSFLVGLNAATFILIGQAYGAKDTARLSRILTNSFLTILILCAFVSIGGVLFSAKILKLVNIPKEIENSAHIYLIVILSGLIFKAIYSWFNGVLKGLGDSKTPLVILAISVLLNIILTPMFITGFGFIPRCGIAGSAFGTILSTFLSALVGYLYLIKRNRFFDLKKWKFSFDLAIVKQMIAIGFPLSAQMMVRSLGWIFLTAIVNTFGATVTAAYGIGTRISMFALLPALSIGISISAISAQNIGAKQFKRVSLLLKKGLLFSFCISLMWYIAVNLFSLGLISIFTKNSLVINYTLEYLRIVSTMYLLLPFIFSLQGIIRSAGHTVCLFVFTTISMIVIRIPLVYYLANFTPLRERGVWLGIVLSTLVGLGLNLFYYLSKRWQKCIICTS